MARSLSCCSGFDGFDDDHPFATVPFFEGVAGRPCSVPSQVSGAGDGPDSPSDAVNRWGGRQRVSENMVRRSLPAVVISDRLWQNRFAGSPAALGKAITLNGVSYTIVGVLKPGFRAFDQPADVYAPLGSWNSLYVNDRTVHDILCIGRLQSQVGVGEARAEMNTVQEHIDQLNPATERGLGAYVVPLKEFLIGDVGKTIGLLLGAVGLVLLIACANVANLLLARSAARTREFAVRLALGASRLQIVRQLIVESVLMSIVGGTLGLAIAKWGVNAVLVAAPGSIPRTENIGVNVPVLVFAFGISMIVGVVFGLLPALKSSKTDVQAGLKEGGRCSTAGHQSIQHLLVVVQIALALVLLTGGSLLFRTIENLWAVNPGFDPRHIITFQVGPSPATTNNSSKLKIAYQQLVETIRQIPGVEAADITALVPMGSGANEGPFLDWSTPARIHRGDSARDLVSDRLSIWSNDGCATGTRSWSSPCRPAPPVVTIPNGSCPTRIADGRVR